jgi:NAD(P)-dependent dehydrogenase (short-subunit alcohol dehydrogenase family)
MKIIVIGGTGTIGSAVLTALTPRHVVISASPSGDVVVDIDDPDSIDSLFRKVEDVDAVIACANHAHGSFGPLEKLTDDQFQTAIRWMMGQVNLTRVALKHVCEGGSITLTTGALATRPRPGCAAASLAGAGLEGFVRAAALEAPRGLRVNSVAPVWVKETMEKLGMDSSSGMPASALAAYYVGAVQGTMSGQVIDPSHPLPSEPRPAGAL